MDKNNEVNLKDLNRWAKKLFSIYKVKPRNQMQVLKMDVDQDDVGPYIGVTHLLYSKAALHPIATRLVLYLRTSKKGEKWIKTP